MDILVNQLKKSYFLDHREVPVLLGIDLEIAKGDFVSLTGASGVGKSTLLHILGTLDAPTSGNISLGGLNPFSQSSADMAQFRNKNIGFVFQFHHLLPELTALENTMLPLLVRRTNADTASNKAKELLALVGLADRVFHKPGELSGGEQQRVALARALVGDPQLLLADEPTGNLDEKTGYAIIELMRQLNQTRGITTLYVTHNPRLVGEAKRQLVLERSGIRKG